MVAHGQWWRKCKVGQTTPKQGLEVGHPAEWTARDTSQQNAPVEVAFHTLAGQARAMLTAAHVPDNKRIGFMPKAVDVATLMDGSVPIRRNGIVKT